MICWKAALKMPYSNGTNIGKIDVVDFIALRTMQEPASGLFLLVIVHWPCFVHALA